MLPELLNLKVMDIKINSYGAELRRYNGSFCISSPDDTWTTLSTEDVESIEIARGTLLTTDAMLLALENDIPIIVVGQSGQTLGRLWNGYANSVSSIRRGQVVFGYTHDGLQWVKRTIADKIVGQSDLLLRRWGADETIHKAAVKMKWICKKLHAVDAPRIALAASNIRSLEGWAARIYFEMMGRMMPDSLKFDKRTQHPAKDGVNAMLNYAYGMIARCVEDAVLKCGLEPSMGLLHDNKRVSSAYFVYDFMEPYRVWTDEVILTLVEAGMADSECFVWADNAMSLTDKGRQMLTIAMKTYMGEIVDHNGMRHTRKSMMQLDVQAFAQKMKSYENRELL